MALWLHMFSWAVLYVPIKSNDLILPEASSSLNIQAFVMKNHFNKPELRN
jgi:hypothetical protein